MDIHEELVKEKYSRMERHFASEFGINPVSIKEYVDARLAQLEAKLTEKLKYRF